MKLHENKTLFRQAVQFTADQMKIPAIYVNAKEPVTVILYSLSRKTGSGFAGGRRSNPSSYPHRVPFERTSYRQINSNENRDK